MTFFMNIISSCLFLKRKEDKEQPPSLLAYLKKKE